MLNKNVVSRSAFGTPTTSAPQPVQKRGMSLLLRRLAARRRVTRAVQTLAVSALFSLGAHAALAATYTYTPTTPGTTDNWSTGTNWSPTAPVSDRTTELTFAPDTTTAIAAGTYTSNNNTTGTGANGGFLLNILDLNGLGPTGTTAATINITGNALEFTSNGGAAPVVNLNGLAGAGGLNYNVRTALILDNTTTFMGNGTGMFNVSGVVSGVGALTKSGTSALTLSGANTFAGGVNLTGGTLNINNASALGTGAFAIGAGTTINNTSGVGLTVSTANPILLNGAFTFGGAQSIHSGTGAITVTAPLTITSNGSLLYLDGAVSGGNGIFDITKAGIGQLVLDNASGYTVTGAQTVTSNAGLETILTPVSGSGSITKTGAGSLTLTGANTFTGGVTLNTGTLNINNAAALGTGLFTINGGMIDASFSGITNSNNNALAFNGSFTFIGTRGLNLGTGATTLAATPVTITTTTAVNALTLGGVISGTGSSLIKAGAGTLTLSGANTFTGGTTLNAGTLSVNNATALGTGTFTINGGTLDSTGTTNLGATAPLLKLNNDFGFAATGNLIFGTAATLAKSLTITTTLNTTNLLSLTGIISDGGNGFGITKAGLGILRLAGANTFTGGVTLNAGTLSINSSGALGTGTFTINGGTIDSSVGVNTNTSTNTLVLNADFTYAGATANKNLNLGTGAATLSGSRTITVSANTLTLGGAISDGGSGFSLTKAGAGTLILGGTNTYTGGTTISAGTLQVGSGGTTGGLGTGAITDNTALAFNLNGPLTVANPISGTGTLTQNGTGTTTLTGSNTYTGGTTINAGVLEAAGTAALPGYNTAGKVVVNTSGTLAAAVGGTGQFASADVDTLLANATFNAGSSLGLDTTGGSFTYGSSVGGVQGLRKLGANTLTLTGSNTYTGGTTITGGTINAASDAALGTGTLVFNPTTGSNATVTFTSTNPGVGSIASSGAGTFSIVLGNTATPSATILTFGSNNTSTTYSGTISDGTTAATPIPAATGGLVKTGTGTQTFANAANSYTGGTTVNGGTLSGNAGSYGSGAIAVAQNATVDYTQGGTTGTATNNISGAGTATFGGNAASANGTGGTVNYTGQDSAATTVQSGTVVLNNASGPALSGPVAIATSGTVQLGADNQIATAPTGTASPTNVALNGGTLNANGNSDGSISGTPSSDPTTSAVTSSMGTLSLGSGTASLLDFGLGSTNSIVAFADSLTSLSTGNGTLNVIDYTGGTDALYIGNSATLTTDELSRITFGGMSGTTQLANGQLAAAPEPSAWASLGVGLVGLGGAMFP